MSERKLKYKVGDEVWAKLVIEDVDLNDDERPYRTAAQDGDIHWGYWMSEAELSGSISNTAPPTKQYSFSVIEVGDVIETLAGDTYKVQSVNSIYMYETEIKAVYKKVWEKEKTLEEMSREELIARIKQLVEK